MQAEAAHRGKGGGGGVEHLPWGALKKEAPGMNTRGFLYSWGVTKLLSTVEIADESDDMDASSLELNWARAWL